MRCVPYFEKKQRGCQYCLHSKNEYFVRNRKVMTACPWDECPFTVLDKYNTYEEFMASDDSKILVGQFFATVTTVYEFSSSPAKTKSLFTDGSSKCFL